MLDGSAVLYEAADPLVRYSPVINCLQLNGFGDSVDVGHAHTLATRGHDAPDL